MTPCRPSAKTNFDKPAWRSHYRNGFIALLAFQPLLAVVLTAISAPNLVALLVCLSVLMGSLVFLGTLLYYDR